MEDTWKRIVDFVSGAHSLPEAIKAVDKAVREGDYSTLPKNIRDERIKNLWKRKKTTVAIVMAKVKRMSVGVIPIVAFRVNGKRYELGLEEEYDKDLLPPDLKIGSIVKMSVEEVVIQGEGDEKESRFIETAKLIFQKKEAGTVP